MSGKRALILHLLPTLSVALPRFEVHWESEKSYEDVDPLVSPWHIRLGLLKQTLSIPIQTSPRSGDIDVGPPGYLGGPSVVTIDSADYCVDSCQESWPDEFCSKYPPEGVPNRPRVVEDWGTKYNISANIVAEGIKSIHERGGQVVLSYGGRHSAQYTRSGIGAQPGGGDFNFVLSERRAELLAQRIHRNIVDWDLDGVDFYNMDVSYSASWSGTYQDPGTSATYAMAVLMHLRRLVGNTKTISYSTISYGVFDSANYFDPDTAIISAIHPYLDFITLSRYYEPLSQEMLTEIEFLGIPLSKIGVIMMGTISESISPLVEQVKELGMAGVSLPSINFENAGFRGELAARIAEELYL